MKPLSWCFPTRAIFALSVLTWCCARPAVSQESASSSAPQKPPQVHDKTQQKEAELPAQIELLETKVRFEVNGDSRKEVHTLVHINNELGVRQFARLSFDYNRSFQQIELPLVRITHASGGTADILPSAVSDQPNPAVINAPAYQDVRVKSIRILGLQPGDKLEYRVVTTTTHHPLAPDFWLDHIFDRSGVVKRELFDVDVPASRKPDIRISSGATADCTVKPADVSRVVCRWERAAPRDQQSQLADDQRYEADVALSTADWQMLSIRLDERLTPGAKRLEEIPGYEETTAELSRTRGESPELTAKATELISAKRTTREKIESLYDFVSNKITTIDLPLGSTGFVARPANEILTSGYATQEDKFVLFGALTAAARLGAEAGLTGYCDAKAPARPTVFKHVLARAGDQKGYLRWIDPSLEVAPFGIIPANSGDCVFVLSRGFYVLSSIGHEWEKLQTDPPFPSTQRVLISASLDSSGTLKSKVRYSMRGQNELLLRVAFHQAPKEKWKEVAQLLALSDGFRGKVTSVTASDPYATKEPFTVEYEIAQPKFVDWSKKLVRIPAVLPLLGLPEATAKALSGGNGNDSSSSTAPSIIELGTPLDVEARVTLHVPPNTSVQAPVGISVGRDYATFASEYSAHNLTLTAVRHIKFLQRKVPAEHAAEYAAFVRSVQNDQAQEFTLERGDSRGAVPTPAKEGHVLPRK